MTISFKSGIYQIVNIANGKRYFGSSVNVYSRRNKHFSHLRRNKHANRYLQNEFNKFGENNFRFFVINFSKKDTLLSKEQEYLNVFAGDRKECYNICEIAGSTYGVFHTEETKKKISDAKIGIKIHTEKSKKIISEKSKKFWKTNKKFREESLLRMEKYRYGSGNKNPMFGKTGNLNSRSKKIFQYSLDGKFLREFESMGLAEKHSGVAQGSISSCVAGKLKKAGMFMWLIKKEEKIEKYTHHKCKPVQMIDIKTNEVIEIFGSMSMAAKFINGDPSSIQKVCNKKRKSAYGFFWRYNK